MKGVCGVIISQVRSLSAFLKCSVPTPFDPVNEIRTCFDGSTVARSYPAVLGLEAIHAAGYVYRDLKLENVLLDKRGYEVGAGRG